MKSEKQASPMPPRWAQWLLNWCCAPHCHEEMNGDLEELFHQRVPLMGLQKARRRYVRDVFSLIRPFSIKRKNTAYSINQPDMLQSYLKIALRNLWRHKVFSFINLSGLGLGLACCMLILLYTKDEVSYDQFFANKERIYRITATMSNEKETRKIASTGAVVGPGFKEAIPGIESFVRMKEEQMILKKNNETFNQEVVYVDSNFFSVFSLQLLAGDPLKVLSGPNSMVMTEEMAQKYFGTSQALGKTLELKIGDAFEPFIVSGIAKRPPQNSSVKFSMLLPFGVSERQYQDREWVNFFLNTFVVLSPQANVKEVEASLDKVFLIKAKDQLAQMKEKFNFRDQVHFGLQPLLQIHLDTEFRETRNGVKDASNPIYSYLLTGIALVILLIACINFINLTVAHSLKRGKEIGVRKVMGGQRSQLIGQFLGESFVLCLIAFVFAIILVELSLPVFNELANKQLSFSYLLDTKLVVGYLALFVVTSLLAGFYPALVLSGFSPVQTLYNRHILTRKSYWTRGSVVFQFMVAGFLIITTVAVYSQFNFLVHKDLGYNDQNLVEVNLGRSDNSKLIQLFKEELAKEPSVEKVATKNFGENYTIAKVDNRDMEFAINWIDENYLPALQIPLVQGRNFSADFPSDADQAVLVNETFVKEAGWKDPLSEKVDFFYDNQQFSVVGVVKDYHFTSLKEKIKPQLFKVGAGNLWVKIRPEQIPQALKAVEKAYKKLVPFRPYQYEFSNEANQRRYEEEAKWKQMITVGAGLSIFIACIGLFGLATLSILQRTKEIGIRKVFGAAVSDIVFLLSVDFMKLIGLAFLFAIPLSYLAIQYWLRDFPYRISVGWWMFVVPCVITLLLALLTIAARTVKAALSNPVNSLRTE
jgi:putative ABC transport system permease protein